MKIKKVTKKQLKRLEKRNNNKLWKEVRQQCISRDEGCIICKSQERMSAHHLIPREIKELKYDLDNLVTLCPKHHKFSLEISAHRNPVMFFVWMFNNRKLQLMTVLTKYREGLKNDKEGI
jgi:Na+-translocating ferredoxin:NAD+ oxidoreductase RNF subunit RnfB